MHAAPYDTLFEPGGTALRLTTISQSQLHDVQTALVERFPHAVIRTMRGHHTRTVQAFLAHVAVVLQFPWHFNETWAEFEHYIAALNDTGANARPHLLLVSNASDMLQDAPPRTFGDLLKLLGKLHKTWSQPRPAGQGTPASLQVLLQEHGAGVGRLQARLITAGVLYEPWKLENV
jgi:hypothetical protein